jgi:hypothetical protein
MLNPGNTKSNRPAQDRIGAGNEDISDSFNEGVVIRVPNNRGVKNIAADNKTFTKAFTGAQFVVFDDPSPDDTLSSTTIASNNASVEHGFERAIITTTAKQSPLVIASENVDVKRSFDGMRIGVGVGPWPVVAGTTSNQASDSFGDQPLPYSYS